MREAEEKKQITEQLKQFGLIPCGEKSLDELRAVLSVFIDEKQNCTS